MLDQRDPATVAGPLSRLPSRLVHFFPKSWRSLITRAHLALYLKTAEWTRRVCNDLFISGLRSVMMHTRCQGGKWPNIAHVCFSHPASHQHGAKHRSAGATIALAKHFFQMLLPKYRSMKVVEDQNHAGILLPLAKDQLRNTLPALGFLCQIRFNAVSNPAAQNTLLIRRCYRDSRSRCLSGANGCSERTRRLLPGVHSSRFQSTYSVCSCRRSLRSARDSTLDCRASQGR